MKRLTCALLAAVLMFAIIGVTAVSAKQNATGEVLVGTPEIDGKVDDIYKKSLTIKSGDTKEQGLTNGHKDGWDMTMTATTWALYDDKYIYICSEVFDNDIVSPADSYMAGTNPYQFDGVEYRLRMTEGNTVKVSVDAFGKRCFGLANHELLFDYSTIKYKTTQTEKSFVIEVAIPREGIFALPDNGEFGIKVQLGDLLAEAAGGTPKEMTNMFTWLPVEDNKEGVTAPVFYKISSAKAAADTTAAPVTTAAPAVTTAAPAVTTAAPAATTPDAPATFDVAIIAAALLAASAGAVVLGKKKH